MDKIFFYIINKETLTQPNADLFPRITDNPDGTKSVGMKFNLPVGVDPTHCNVTIKDRDLILRCEDKKVKEDSVSKYHYYQVIWLNKIQNLKHQIFILLQIYRELHFLKTPILML